MPGLPITFVVPWYDPSGLSGGGAERHCREYAIRLTLAGHDVEVLTTCSRDHDASWYSNYHPAGRSRAPEGYFVERFPVRRGERERFQDLNRQILHGRPLTFREERAFLENSIQSDALADAVRVRGGRRAIIAMPYLFGIVWRILMENPNQILLWPLLHDEGYARLKLIGEAMSRARGIIYNSPSEAELIQRLHPVDRPAILIGLGVDVPEEKPLHEEGSPWGRPYFLYLGRQSVEKGVPQLREWFSAFAARESEPVQLLLAGKGGDAGVVATAPVVNLGFVSEGEKERYLHHCISLIMPSVHESFSLALLEALARGVPGLVNAACPVTRAHVQAGQCGLWYDGPQEFAECAAMLVRNPQLRCRLGENGRRYVRTNFRWADKLEALVTFLQQLGYDGG